MYVPEHFSMSAEGDAWRLVDASPFATLVSSGDAGLEATHLPTVAKHDAGAGITIEAHLARANEHWRRLDGADVLLVYLGPDAYIRPGWYPSKTEHGKVVPTWNYSAVHVHGRASIERDTAWLIRHVGELTDAQERGQPAPWATADAPGNYIEIMSRGIVGLSVKVARFEAKAKLSQNRTPGDRAGVVAGLGSRGREFDEAVAASIREGLGEPE